LDHNGERFSETTANPTEGLNQAIAARGGNDAGSFGDDGDNGLDSGLDAVDYCTPNTEDETIPAYELGWLSHISNTNETRDIDIPKVRSELSTSAFQKTRGRKRKLSNPTAPAPFKKRQRREVTTEIRRGYKWASMKVDKDGSYPRVKIENLETAIQYAIRLSFPDDLETQPRLLFWADASGLDKKTNAVGAGLTYQRHLGENLPWVYHAYSVFGIIDTSDAEGFAIERALTAAFLEAQPYYHPPTSEGEETLPIVYIFSDSQSALGGIRRRIINEPGDLRGQNNKVLDLVMLALDRLVNMSILVELRWIPGHAGLQGNEIADKLASWGRKFASWIPKDVRHTDAESVQAHLAPSDMRTLMKSKK
jgi:hypothetical protein